MGDFKDIDAIAQIERYWKRRRELAEIRCARAASELRPLEDRVESLESKRIDFARRLREILLSGISPSERQLSRTRAALNIIEVHLRETRNEATQAQSTLDEIRKQLKESSINEAKWEAINNEVHLEIQKLTEFMADQTDL